MEHFFDIFAGLGLFFAGVKHISANLKQLSGGWFRRLTKATTYSSFISAFVGLLSGALTQSTNAITFISISMVTAGLVSVSSILPMVIWANVGTSALVLLSAININLLILFLLGLTGVAYYFDVNNMPRFRHVLGAVLGLGLLFMGLELIKSGAIPLKTLPAVRDILAFAASSYVFAFLLGAAFTVVAQSSATVSIIAVTMTNLGLLTMDQTIVVIVGASLGSGISIALLSANLSGVGRQIAWLQVGVKLIGVILILPLLIGEDMGFFPGIRALVLSITDDRATQVALVYLILQLISAIAMTLIRGRAMALIAKLSPPTLQEMLSKPHFIYPEAVDDPSTALDLVVREQVRLFEFLPQILDSVRSEGETKIDGEALFTACRMIARQCESFLTDVLDKNQSRDVLVDIIGMEKRNEILLGLITAVHDYTDAIKRAESPSEEGKFGQFLFALGESLHTILDLANNAFATADKEDVDLLLEFTSDRSTQMERMRRKIMDIEDITPAQHDVLYASTTLFERILWLIRRFASLVERKQTVEEVAA